jgi:hypothetical protein
MTLLVGTCMRFEQGDLPPLKQGSDSDNRPWLVVAWAQIGLAGSQRTANG